MTKPPQRTYDKTCIECEKPFTGRRSDAQYCTELCAGRARYRRNLGSRRALSRDNRTCLECGQTFTAKRSDARFCSTQCNKRFYYEENRERMLEQNRQWAREHPAEVKAIKQRHEERHGEENRARKRKRYAAVKADPAQLEARQEYHRQWYEAHRDEVLERTKRRREADPFASLYYKHGTDWRTLVNSFLDIQDGKCYLCGDPLRLDGFRAVHLDHDHRCCPLGRSCEKCRRGLACADCNRLIGGAKDNPERLRRIADNLERANAEVRQRMAADESGQGELFFTA